MTAGCAVGELIKLEEGKTGRNRAVEIFMAETRQARKGEELEFLRWDEVKKREEKRVLGGEQEE